MITQLDSGVVSDLETARQCSLVEERNLQKSKEEDKMTMTMRLYLDSTSHQVWDLPEANHGTTNKVLTDLMDMVVDEGGTAGTKMAKVKILSPDWHLRKRTMADLVRLQEGRMDLFHHKKTCTLGMAKSHGTAVGDQVVEVVVEVVVEEAEVDGVGKAVVADVRDTEWWLLSLFDSSTNLCFFGHLYVRCMPEHVRIVCTV